LDEYVVWHNEINPHLRLNIEELEATIQAFHSESPPEQQAIVPTEAGENDCGKLHGGYRLMLNTS
jgi:hypothetical protein